MKELEDVKAKGASSYSAGSSSRPSSTRAESSQNWSKGDSIHNRHGGGGGTSSKGSIDKFDKRSEAQNPARLDQIPPKEDYELPMLSQPLELLAHASIQVQGQEDPKAPEDASQNPTLPSQRSKIAVGGPARGEAFFSSGLCDNKEDHFDPIELGVIPQQLAVQLFNVFMEKMNEPLILLDPSLHSFNFVRGSSSLLLTCICWLASLFDPNASDLTYLLDHHIQKTILPAIYMESYRSVEIAQSFILLAFYHPPAKTLSEDKSWQYIGQAARIGSELGMNRLSRISPDRERQEDFMRRVRNRER